MELIISLSFLLLYISASRACAFTSTLATARFNRVSTSYLAYSASDLLYEDQQKARARRAAHEQQLLGDNIKPLIASKITKAPVKRGSGFGSGKQDIRSPAQRLAAHQAKELRKDGVIRIDNTLGGGICDRLRKHLLRQQELADIATSKNIESSEAYYGVENRRKNRCDLLLSLVSEGEKEQGDDDIILDTLQEALGAHGSLRPIYEELVSNEGEFYEFAGIITNPGSDRQQIHPDLPHREEAPLYVIFLALQDITSPMGPTTFLLGTQSKKERAKFDDMSKKDEQLENAKSRVALLNKGDCVLFDARILHCGNANVDFDNDSTRVMFNFSFRNPKESGNLGYCGSMRPGYVGRMTLGDVGAELANYSNGLPAFAKYGDGISY